KVQSRGPGGNFDGIGTPCTESIARNLQRRGADGMEELKGLQSPHAVRIEDHVGETAIGHAIRIPVAVRLDSELELGGPFFAGRLLRNFEVPDLDTGDVVVA